MNPKTIFTNDFWKGVESLKLYPEQSTEADDKNDVKQDTLAGAAQEAPPGGENSSDAGGKQESDNDETTQNSNEQDNEMDGTGGDTMSNPAPDSNSGMSDTSGDIGGGSQDGDIKLDPSENPFKAQNGKEMLDKMLQSLHSAVDDILSKVTANSNIDAVVVSKLEDLKDDIDCVLDTVYIQPKESTMYRYSIQVQTYKILCNMLNEEIKKSIV
jgi:hypothetical protein